MLAAAVDGTARYLVTGDKAFRALGAFRGVEIVTPREIVELLGIGADRDSPKGG